MKTPFRTMAAAALVCFAGCSESAVAEDSSEGTAAPPSFAGEDLTDSVTPAAPDGVSVADTAPAPVIPRFGAVEDLRPTSTMALPGAEEGEALCDRPENRVRSLRRGLLTWDGALVGVVEELRPVSDGPWCGAGGSGWTGRCDNPYLHGIDIRVSSAFRWQADRGAEWVSVPDATVRLTSGIFSSWVVRPETTDESVSWRDETGSIGIEPGMVLLLHLVEDHETDSRYGLNNMYRVDDEGILRRDRTQAAECPVPADASLDGRAIVDVPAFLSELSADPTPEELEETRQGHQDLIRVFSQCAGTCFDRPVAGRQCDVSGYPVTCGDGFFCDAATELCTAFPPCDADASDTGCDEDQWCNDWGENDYCLPYDEEPSEERP